MDSIRGQRSSHPDGSRRPLNKKYGDSFGDPWERPSWTNLASWQKPETSLPEIWSHWSQYKESLSTYRNSHYKDKTVVRPAYLYNWDSYTGEASLYWDQWDQISGKDIAFHMGISIIKIRRLWDRLIFIMGIPVLVRHLCVTTVPERCRKDLTAHFPNSS